MKPEGRKPVHFPGKHDVHPKKGYVNWWETITSLINRKTRKQQIIKEIRQL